MSLYPTLEDLKVDQLMKAQLAQDVAQHMPAASAPYPIAPASVPIHDNRYAHLYPQLDDYMGIQLSQQPAGMAVAVQPAQTTVAVAGTRPTHMVAPLTGDSVGLARAQVTHGIREVLLCKNSSGKVGLRLQAVDKGVFVILVEKHTPAALAGLRFGDQILMINDVTVAGYSWEKVHDLIRKSNPDRITMVVRDRPFERTLTVNKDSTGCVGFQFKNGKIITIVKDSSAARNGLLIDHNLLEIDGQNVVGLKDKDTGDIIRAGGRAVTLTLMPSYIYDRLIKNTASSYLKKAMDHSIPEI